MSEGTSPSSSSNEGSRSTRSNFPKATTRQRKKKTYDSEDEEYVVVEDEATSRKKVLKKEYSIAAATKPGMKTKAPARRVPMSKVRASTAETSKPTEEAVGEGKKRKERVKKTIARVIGKSSMVRSDDEEEEDAAPAPKLRSLWEMQLSQGLLHLSPNLVPRLLLKNPQNPRVTPGVYLLRRRTRPQCLKLKKRMMKPYC